MMNNAIPDGVWPTMVTPFTADNEIDYHALEAMIEWYIDRGVAGLFAVCQSSEMWTMTLAERVALAEFVAKQAGGRVPVMASGHISDPLDDQIDELLRMADTGVQAIVLVTNRLAAQNESDEVFIKNVDKVIKFLPEDLHLGFYECPYPYKRLLSPSVLSYCEQTGRFYFLKDTSCDIDNMQAKMNALQGKLKIFNANAATLYETLKIGISGYSGVMANFHPELYAWALKHWREGGDFVQEVFDTLGLASVIEHQSYPINAKYHMQLSELPILLNSRVAEMQYFSRSQQMEVEQLKRTISRIKNRLPNNQE